ncbi:hypothetical protein SAMN05192532_10149 [Alteribacillus iranensis]|uniref:Transcriptional regulator n=1 Tax=Alteribacillus iranensis TaxID=930128 RepID=A0A1I1Z5X0_9BACI|nr:transcription repressor NadR [Alteribacillus iranensis]SFE26962.1 hypothetical protein SAMN05192532_10149 [Alteribacillus iranensis]
MDKNNKKILGEERRELIMKWLVEEDEPITGSDLAARTKVSRQVIVQDISLLKAKSYPILATSRGYMLLKDRQEKKLRRQIPCFHPSDIEITEMELNIFVDHGAKVIDVSIEHPIYGDLTASLMIETRRDVQQFVKNLRDTNAPLLSELTDGTHIHTVEVDSERALREIESELEKKGMLLT